MNKPIEHYDYFLRIKKVVESCETPEQLMNALNWAKQVKKKAPSKKIKEMISSLEVNYWK